MNVLTALDVAWYEWSSAAIISLQLSFSILVPDDLGLQMFPVMMPLHFAVASVFVSVFFTSFP